MTTITTIPPAPPKAAPRSTRASEITYIILFLTIIFSVPIIQTLIELRRHERVQFTDVFRYRPTDTNLRQYEKNLEDKSVFQQSLRPPMQQFYFTALRDPGSKAILGRPGWIFYRLDVRYLIEPNSPEPGDPSSTFLTPEDHTTLRDSVLAAIVRFRDQLKQRNIALLVIPIPGKPSIYPDQLPYVSSQSLHSPTQDLLAALNKQDVPTIDLFTLFHTLRQSQSEPLYLQTDTHWTPHGTELAAQAVAHHIRTLNLAPKPSRDFLTTPITVARIGDILDMTQVPNIQSYFPPELVLCTQISDSKTGPLIPTLADRPGSFRHPSRESQILVLGDSFCRIYQTPEPKSLGQIPTTQPDPNSARRPLPGSAGFISHLAFHLKAPLDYIISDGGASTDVRRKLSTNAQLLAGKKLVIWQFIERDIRLGKEGWQDIPLPTQLEN
ncbi:MAG: hypothetical protein NTU53_20425 [Planctomycetota bacterium]|nr:hypothetical protein [Planctomycetota bacterium]